jgi:hypothetical protein
MLVGKLIVSKEKSYEYSVKRLWVICGR